jgi:hypothetical protein
MAWDTFPRELGDFAEILARLSETEQTANALLTRIGAFENTWRKGRLLESGAGIQIPSPRNKALHPRSCEVIDAEISFFFELGADIETDLFPAQFDFQVRVRGIAKYDVSEVELEDHWRVDTHKILTAERPWEPHPKVHFQRGGHAQDSFAQNPDFLPGQQLPRNLDGPWRSLLQSPGPRIPFPPSCPVIAIDYVIGQHDGIVHRKLRESPEYRAIVSRAQSRLWTPFFRGLADSPRVRQTWLGDVLSDP